MFECSQVCLGPNAYIRGICNSQNPVRDCTILEDCEIVTLPKQPLYVICDFMCDYVICRPSRTLINGNLWKNFQNYTKLYREIVFKDCKVQKIAEISRRLYKIVRSCRPLAYISVCCRLRVCLSVLGCHYSMERHGMGYSGTF